MTVIMYLYIWNKVVPLSGRAGTCVAVAEMEAHAIAAIERNVGVNPGPPDVIAVLAPKDMPVAMFVSGPKKKHKKRK